jgi:hypothetical protein
MDAARFLAGKRRFHHQTRDRQHVLQFPALWIGELTLVLVESSVAYGV